MSASSSLLPDSLQLLLHVSGLLFSVSLPISPSHPSTSKTSTLLVSYWCSPAIPSRVWLLFPFALSSRTKKQWVCPAFSGCILSLHLPASNIIPFPSSPAVWSSPSQASPHLIRQPQPEFYILLIIMAWLLPWLSFHPASVHLPLFCGRPPSVLFGQVTAWVWAVVIMVGKYLQEEGEKLLIGEFQGRGQGVNRGEGRRPGHGRWVRKMCGWCCRTEYIINPLCVDRGYVMSISLIPGSAWKGRIYLAVAPCFKVEMGRDELEQEDREEGMGRETRGWNHNKKGNFELNNSGKLPATQLELVI